MDKIDPNRNAVCPPYGPAKYYSLPGPQVEPDAGFWAVGACPTLCTVRIEDLIQHTDNPASPFFFPPYPTTPAILDDEIDELVELASQRDDPERVFNDTPGRRRRQISQLLHYRAQPLGAVFSFPADPVFAAAQDRLPPEPNLQGIYNGDEFDARFPVVRTGRELARYFEAETPGLAHRHALNYLIRDANRSPPRQAWVWAALDVTIYSALAAAWYYKWFADAPCSPSHGHRPPGMTSFRPRPIEYDQRVSVLFNRAVNSPHTGDGMRRMCPDPSPGTPRHPAYPSGHSTYSAAASELLSWFFPDYREEFNRLADNAGMARLWAGIHWRSDHVNGAKLGRAVACLVIDQLCRSCIRREPDPCAPPMNDCPPTFQELCAMFKKREECCREHHRDDKRREKMPFCEDRPCANFDPNQKPAKVAGAAAAPMPMPARSNESIREQSRGPQQGGR